MQLQIVYRRVSALKPILFTFSYFTSHPQFEEKPEQIGFLSFSPPRCLLTVRINLFAKGNRKSLSIAGSIRVVMWEFIVKLAVEWWQEICVSNSSLVRWTGKLDLSDWRSLLYDGASITLQFHSLLHRMNWLHGDGKTNRLSECGQQTIDLQFVLMNNVNVASNYRRERRNLEAF